jgi:hypothetical protein
MFISWRIGSYSTCDLVLCPRPLNHPISQAWYLQRKVSGPCSSQACLTYWGVQILLSTIELPKIRDLSSTLTLIKSLLVSISYPSTLKRACLFSNIYDSPLPMIIPQPNFSVSTVVRDSSSYGVTLHNVQPRRSMSAWSTIVESFCMGRARHDRSCSVLYHVIISSLVETGGLLRIAIKLMMACSTTNRDMWDALIILLCHIGPTHSWWIYL